MTEDMSWWIPSDPLRHIEFVRRPVSEETVEAVLSILRGESVQQWQARQHHEKGEEDS